MDPGFIPIGSEEVINRRDKTIVKCYPDTVVNDYVPFYFSVRTPMLFNIITGHGVSAFPQENILYICIKLCDLATNDFQWCYTDGNASAVFTRFYTDFQNIENNIDWRSIETTDFREDNSDGDEDRIRKKHAEFLVKGHVPSDYIKVIVVLNQTKKEEVESKMFKFNHQAKVSVNPNQKFYFL